MRSVRFNKTDPSDSGPAPFRSPCRPFHRSCVLPGRPPRSPQARSEAIGPAGCRELRHPGYASCVFPAGTTSVMSQSAVRERVFPQRTKPSAVESVDRRTSTVRPQSATRSGPTSLENRVPHLSKLIPAGVKQSNDGLPDRFSSDRTANRQKETPTRRPNELMLSIE